MELKGKRVRIAPLKLEDVYAMRNWGTHENPLLFDYNLPPLTDEELKNWHYYKTSERNRKYFSIFDEDHRLIGYLGIKSIRKIFKDSVLGIVFDPNNVNKGYGTEAITTFLDYYFNEMNMRKMYLDVAKFNKRALRCYKKSGFKIINLYLDDFFDQNIDVNNSYFVKEKSSFIIKKGRIYNYIYRMKIDKATYLKERDKIDTTKSKNQTKPNIE
ncbi:GNAT family N-acetyltransferase [Schnuerera sp. xch1]|uniref:GNAT family N-acetyltransferase n=1 Tax=Schnuerera sp. xch1 TaxID=2874283 RepID=UPI001CBE4D12|nr:GNAT family protein [Schnuerera sp. xch1]MBZ2175416.1 GNAT family N-acetyltransferase [Schnuerera sp. xch1]